MFERVPRWDPPRINSMHRSDEGDYILVAAAHHSATVEVEQAKALARREAILEAVDLLKETAFETAASLVKGMLNKPQAIAGA